MPIRTWGCLNKACYPFEFDSTEEDPTCPQCGGPVKWVPGRTNIARPMPYGRKSVSAHAEEILRGAVDRYNDKVPLPGLKLGDLPHKPPVPQQQATMSYNFRDAGGKMWPATIPVGKNGVPYGCVPVPGMTKKIAFRPDMTRGRDKPPRVE